MTLSEIREKIDRLDGELLRLLNERADLVHEVGIVKRKDDLDIYAPEREEQLLQRLVKANEEAEGRLPASAIRAIYREIMSAALALESNLTIAYLGPDGTWTHQAALNKFGASVNYAPQANIPDVFDEVARGRAHYGVVPIENSTEGAVNHTLDVFTDSSSKICAQILLKIENCLMANIPREEIKFLYSHPQVFGQCRDWLRHHLPHAELIEVSSTTKAAEVAAGKPAAAALGGKLAAELHKLEVLEENIQDSATNTTRFLVIGNRTCPSTGSDRTSLMFSVRDRPGSLYSALKPFNEFDINMSKIESRPSRRQDWEYFFFVDVKGHCSNPKLIAALEELEKHCTLVKILGSYPDTEL